MDIPPNCMYTIRHHPIATELTMQAAEVEYREIPDFPGYRVGSDGTVWSRRIRGRGLKEASQVPVFAEEWRQLKTPTLGNGYPSIALRRNGKVVTLLVHQLVLTLFVGPCPTGMEACHSPDRTKTNCRLDNLRWDTPKANAEDKESHGTLARGETHGHAILTEEIVRELRARHATGESVSSIARSINMHRVTVREAIRGITWSHVL